MCSVVQCCVSVSRCFAVLLSVLTYCAMFCFFFKCCLEFCNGVKFYEELQTWKMYLASLALLEYFFLAQVIFLYELMRLLSRMAKILSSMLYQAVGGKIIPGLVTFIGYVTLPSQGNFTQTDVVYPAWVWLPNKCCKHCICTLITLFCRGFKMDVILALSGKIWKQTILLE